MQGMLFLGDKQVALREFPTPSGPTGRQVVVKMRASGLCGSDLTPYRAVPGDLGIGHTSSAATSRAATSSSSARTRATSASATASWSTTTAAAAGASNASPAGGTCAPAAR